MIKHRLVALFFRSISLGVFVYAIYQTWMDATIYHVDWVDTLMLFPNYFMLFTILIQLYLVIKGIFQSKKSGMHGITKLNSQIRGGFAITGILMILVYHMLFHSSNPTEQTSLLQIVRHDFAGVFWMLDGLLFDERHQTKNYSPFLWLIIQVYGYLGVVFVRSRAASSNPFVYDILDWKKYGVAGVGKNVVVISVIYVLVGVMYCALDQISNKANIE